MWRALCTIAALAAAFVAAFWIIWAISNDDRVTGWAGLALLVGYFASSLVVARRTADRPVAAAQLITVSVAVVAGLWIFGAIVALALWGEPLGPAD